MFKKVLVANRGEIAVRIIRSLREMGIPSAVVYSEVDRYSLHVRFADEAYCIGGALPEDSYLDTEKIISIAKKSKAEAIHPGYGFLSENHHFVKKCQEEGIIFIGPKPDSMEIMGDKNTARNAMIRAGIPVVPGTDRLFRDEEVMEKACQLGYPVMVKASSGGGGKGLRLVMEAKDMPSCLRLARSEAKSAFGNGDIYLEKYLESPRHVEFQILADNYGHVIHLYDRECSIQRRHQKVIEEAPAPAIDDRTRKKMAKTAIEAAKAVGYVNAGTIEFLVDKYGNFYFLEMNTRLQVEHPVTEMITGLDMVKLQVEIAMGHRLLLRQKDIIPRGSAIECRIYAEDPDNQFLPSPGKIDTLRVPGGPGIRDDTGVYAGYEVPVYYDPLISKLVVWGSTRHEAVKRMERALKEYVVKGIRTTIPFHLRVMKNEKFIGGNFNTNFIDQEFFVQEHYRIHPYEKIAILMAAVNSFSNNENKGKIYNQRESSVSHWKLLGRKIAISRGQG